MKIFTLFFALCLYAGFTSAGTDLTMSFYPNPLIYSGTADAAEIGQSFGPEWAASASSRIMCQTSGIATASVSPVMPSAGFTTVLNGVTYEVFNTLTPGIGWVMGVKDTNATNYSALKNIENQWYPAPGTSENIQNTIGGLSQVTLIKTTSHLKTGVTTLPAENIAQIKCYSSSGALVDSAFIRINSVDINVTAKGCEVSSADNMQVSLDNHYINEFPDIGSHSPEKTITVDLKCDAGINVEATVSDQSNLANTTDTMSLSADSTAKGLGIQTLYNNSVVSYGPDNSSSGNLNQFFIQSTVSDDQIISVPLSFRYVRTGDLEVGSANGLMGVTFSYQ